MPVEERYTVMTAGSKTPGVESKLSAPSRLGLVSRRV